MKRSWTWCSGLVLVSVLLIAGASKPQVILRIHVQTEGKGLSSNQVFPVQLRQPEETIFVRAQPEISEADLIAVEDWAAEDSGQAVQVQFNSRGQQALNALTLQHQGQAMVIFLNGRVIYSALIDVNLSRGTLIIPRGVAETEVAMLKAQVKKNLK
jgi:preprotein translocase subunit SecD